VKKKLFSFVGFIFDAIKVVASLAVILMVFAVGFAIYRTASVL
jgi:hypothetical protein